MLQLLMRELQQLLTWIASWQLKLTAGKLLQVALLQFQQQRGVSYLISSFGWIISSDLGDRDLAHGMGPARGAKVNSYHAEAYVMLAILCFLHQLAEFTTQEPWMGILATDSLLDSKRSNQKRGTIVWLSSVWCTTETSKLHTLMV